MGKVIWITVAESDHTPGGIGYGAEAIGAVVSERSLIAIAVNHGEQLSTLAEYSLRAVRQSQVILVPGFGEGGANVPRRDDAPILGGDRASESKNPGTAVAAIVRDRISVLKRDIYTDSSTAR